MVIVVLCQRPQEATWFVGILLWIVSGCGLEIFFNLLPTTMAAFIVVD
jgi:hypothetical protein